MAKYYKVVKKEQDYLVSAMIKPIYQEYFRVYQKDGINQIVPSGLAFESYEQAESWKKLVFGSSYLHQIWECSGKKDKLPKRVYELWLFHTNVEAICNFLKFGKNKNKHERYTRHSFPKGTVKLRNLKLERQIG